MLIMNEIVIDGSASPKSLNYLSNIKSIEINGYDSDTFQNEKIVDYIIQLENKDKIRKLNIAYGTVLENLEILKYFSNIEDLIIRSDTILSFDGLEHFKKGEFLLVETGKNSKRSFGELSSKYTLKRIDMEFGNLGDYEAISNCSSLDSLILSRAPAPTFKAWSNVPLKYLKFWDYCKFKELEDMAYLSNLSEVMIGACQKFERFKGDNSNIKELYITGSKYFDITSLQTCSSLEKLYIESSIPLISLDDLPTLNNLEEMSIDNIKIDFGNYELEGKMPSLKNIYLGKGKKDDIIKLSKNNKNIIVSKNDKDYLNGDNY